MPYQASPMAWNRCPFTRTTGQEAASYAVERLVACRATSGRGSMCPWHAADSELAVLGTRKSQRHMTLLGSTREACLGVERQGPGHEVRPADD